MRQRSSGAKLPRMMPAQSPALPLLRALLVAAALVATSGAWAQWQWKDASGRNIFSDTPPPASVPDSAILKRPKGSAPASATMSPSTETSTSSALPAQPTAPMVKPAPSVDNQLEQRKQQMDKADADKRKAEEKAAEEKAAKARAVNCENARKNKATIESGVRVTVSNAKGEAEYLDEAGRAAQLRQANEVIRENCR